MSEHVSFLCYIHLFAFAPAQCAPIARLSRTIHQHIFSCLVGAQFTDCIICLASTHLFWFAQTITISPVHLCFWVWTCLYMFHFHVSYLSIPIYSHRLATMDHHPKGSALLSWRTEGHPSPHSFGSTHSCLFHSSPQNPHYQVQPPLTSRLNWSEKTPSHPNTGIKTLDPTLLKAASPCRPFKSFLPPTLLPTRRYISASIALSTSSLQANVQKDMADIEREWKTIWEVFPELSKNPSREPATIPSSISSTISHTNISLPLTTPSSHPTPPTPTPILTPQTISTTRTPPHQPQPLSPLSHPSYPPNNHSGKRQKILLAPHPQPPLQQPQPPCPSTRPRLPSCPRNHVPKGETIRPDNHPKEKPTHTQSGHFHQFQAKATQKYPLPFIHNRTNLTTRPTTHPTTSSIPSTTSNTKIAPLLHSPPLPIHNTPTTRNTSKHNTLTTITNTTFPTTTINTTCPPLPITTINAATTITTTAATQTQIPPLMGLDVSLPPKLLTPSVSLTIPLSSSSPPSLIFLRTLQDLQQSGLWGTLLITAATQGSHHHLAILKKFNT